MQKNKSYTIIKDGDKLNFTGDFYNKGIILQYKVHLFGNSIDLSNSANLYDTSIQVIAQGAIIENLNIYYLDNSAQSVPILISDASDVTINNNNIYVENGKHAYGIYLLQSDNNIITNNNIHAKGDFLTFGILVLGSENNKIENNNVQVTGTGFTVVSGEICIDGEILNNGETCIDGEILSGDEVCIDGEILTTDATCLDGEIASDGQVMIDNAHVIPEIFHTYGIILIYSSNNSIKNNIVFVNSSLSKNHSQYDYNMNSIVGIDLYFDSNDNIVSNNQICIDANDRYLYGLGVLGAETNTGNSYSKNNKFLNNIVEINGSYYVDGFISGYHSNNTYLENNQFKLNGDTFIYGITLEISEYNFIKNNTVDSYGGIIYLIESFSSNNNIVNNNTLHGVGQYVYGIALYSTSNNSYFGNDINAIGNMVVGENNSEINISNPVNHTDAILYGNAGVFLYYGSNNNSFNDNLIISTGEYTVSSNLNDSNIKNNIFRKNYLKSNNRESNEAISLPKDNIIDSNYANFFDCKFPDFNVDVNGSVNLNMGLRVANGSRSGNEKLNSSNVKTKFYIYNANTNSYEYIGEAIYNSSISSDFSISSIYPSIYSNLTLNWRITPDMGIGTYNILAIVSGDGFKEEYIYSTLTVNPSVINLDFNDFSGKIDSIIELSAKVSDKYGNPLSNIEVRFYDDYLGYIGKSYTNSKGIAIFNFNVPKTYSLGHHILSAVANSYSSSNNNYNNNYNNISLNSMMNILEESKINSKLTITAKSITVGSTAIIKGVLKTNNGQILKNQRITLKLNGKTYNKNTNTKGEVSFNIKGLSVGSKKFTISYAGNSNYLDSNINGLTVSKTITVKSKADLRITKIKRSGNKYLVSIKNYGQTTSKANKIAIYLKFGKKTYYKIASVKAISSSKTITTTVNFYNYSLHKKYTKTAWVNCYKTVVESNYKNNKKTFK
ncbi:MAG: Ig-like domain-containing protein [Methanobrevibacter sp.]|nr:Ig-like domain-containing protein [Candidatus Methanoflexus mossambicus]